MQHTVKMIQFEIKLEFDCTQKPLSVIVRINRKFEHFYTFVATIYSSGQKESLQYFFE